MATLVLRQKYIDAIKEFEGWHPKPYWDYRQWTNGYGTRAKHKNERITRSEGEKRLRSEVAKAEKYVVQHADDLPEGIHAALTSLTYNAGPSWRRLGLGRAIARRDWADAKRRFVQYNKAGGKTLKGLVRRRLAEVKWFDDRFAEAEPVTLATPEVADAPTVTQALPDKYNYTPWLTVAIGFMDAHVDEIKGEDDNAVIVALWRLGRAATVNDDETPWCAAFMSAVLELAGIKSARSGWARDHLNWGTPQSEPCVGSTVIFKRGSGGHVGIVVGRTPAGELAVLGGNQSDSINIRGFSEDRVLGYRWPKGYPMPEDKSLPTIRAGRSLDES